MELGAIFVGLAMLVATLPFIVGPFKKETLNGTKNSTDMTPAEQKQAVMSALRDLDFDFGTGKVSEEDYVSLRAQLVTEAAEHIQSEESIEDEQIETMISARKASLSKGQECSNCGTAVEAESRFCSQCGTSMENNCPSCGKAVQAADIFCTACGMNLEVEMEHTA